MLGGLRYLIPVIQAAHEEGYYVITCDYLPSNIAHKYSDEYHNVSIVDKDVVLELARRLQVNGIISFAVDPGVVTAHYVAEQLGLPGASPYKSVEILQNKALFREFLTNNGFVVPKSRGYKTKYDALQDVAYYSWPIIVKPVDSAGSKGVTRVDHVDDLSEAIDNALNNSLSKNFIIEEFIENQGCSSDSDAFSVDGELKCISFSDQYFDCDASNPYTPASYSWPSQMKLEYQTELTSELQRLLTLLDMKSSIYNVETRVGKDGKCYIMEVSPRGGGNRLSEMLRYCSGVDLIRNSVRAAVGDEITDVVNPVYSGHWAEIILHACQKGEFKELAIDDSIKQYVHEIDLWIAPGDQVNAFSGANDAIGTLVMKFNTKEEFLSVMPDQKRLIKVVVS